jgi:hypothetical protein
MVQVPVTAAFTAHPRRRPTASNGAAPRYLSAARARGSCRPPFPAVPHLGCDIRQRWPDALLEVPIEVRRQRPRPVRIITKETAAVLHPWHASARTTPVAWW